MGELEYYNDVEHEFPFRWSANPPKGYEAINTPYGAYAFPGQGETYPVFTDNASRIRNDTWYITRSQRKGVPQDLMVINNKGEITIGYKNTNPATIVFGFCI